VSTKPGQAHNPVLYSDPFGLKVEVADSAAEQSYNRLRQFAQNAANSRNGEHAAAGKKLLGMLDALERTAQPSFKVAAVTVCRSSC